MKTYQQCSASHPRKPVSGNYKPESPKFSEKSLRGWPKLQSGEFRTLSTFQPQLLQSKAKLVTMLKSQREDVGCFQQA